MNDYDDLDDYSSSNFRARSNTWPLNRPDLALPSSGVCIDETLPEIELEDDDLFTTNENWSTGLVDHDIMSWDPILNAQSHQQQQQHQQQQTSTSTQPSTIHHHHQPQQQAQHQHSNQPQQPPSQQQQQHQQPSASQDHQMQASLDMQNHHHHQQQQNAQSHVHHHHQQHNNHQDPQAQSQHHQHHHQHQHHHHHQHGPAPQQQNDPYLDITPNPAHIIAGSPNGRTIQQQLSPQPHHHHQQQQQQQPHVHQHQTLTSVHCLEPDDPNEFHIQQLHHLHLDNNPNTLNEHQPDPYTNLSSICVHNQTTANLNNDNYNTAISSDHHHHNHHHHLQPLAATRYDADPHINYDLKASHEDTLNHNPLEHHQHHHHQHHPQQQQPVMHQHHHDPHQPHHHIHQMTSSSLDNQSSGSHMLSSSLSTSGIGLSGDLEDLDYKQNTEPSSILNYDEHELQDGLHTNETQQNSNDSVLSDNKQSESNSASKTKLNAPRRNAWGNMSYADLISQAINSTSDKRLTLSQIYDWMVQHVPYFKDKGDSNSSAGWKNSVRHNLSLHSRFKRLQNEGTGKSSWWTINPEANIGKCARRRAASMEASKYEKKRGRAKKKAEAIRQGLISYPSLTNSSLNGSTSALDQQQSQAQSLNQFNPKSSQPSEQQQQHQVMKQFPDQQPPTMSAQQPHRPQLQVQTLDQYGIDHPSQQQQQHLQQLQQSDALNIEDLNNGQQSQHQQQSQNIFMLSAQSQQQPLQHHPESSHFDGSSASSKIQQQQQQQQQQQSQYYYQFELSTAL